VFRNVVFVIFFQTFLVNETISQCVATTIFKEDFGTGANGYGPALNSNITSYTYNATSSLADGEYSIRKTAAPLNGQSIYATWHNGFDHTGNNGYMMVINASYTAGKFYETQINNLCSGSTIKFSAWLANLLKLGVSDPLDPIVKFEIKSAISGAVLGSYTTATINRYTNFTWEQFGFNIVLPLGETSVILTIYNNQAGGLGNDLVLDDIEFSICGADISPSTSGTYQNGNSVCVGNSITFNAGIINQFYTTPVMQWQSSVDSISWTNILGANQSSYTIANCVVADSKWYRFLIAEPSNINSPNCRTTSSPIRLNVFNKKPIQLQHKILYCVGDTVQIKNSTSAFQYNWKGPNGFVHNDSVVTLNNVSTNQQGYYSLQSITDGGCINIDSSIINIKANQLTLMLPDSLVLCNNVSASLNTNNAFITKWLWSNGDTTQQINVTTAGLYWVKVWDNVCMNSDTTVVKTNRTPVVKLGGNKTICFSETLKLIATDIVATSYLWNNGSTDSVLNITNSGTYSVIVSNECGSANGSVDITVEPCANQIFVPTAFTPNGDFKNEVLKAKAFFPITDFVFRIYNRLGQMIFLSTDINKGWNGEINNKKAPNAVYIWELSYKKNGELFQQNGTTVLMR
jgi:gliding motility-associated-like protein